MGSSDHRPFVEIAGVFAIVTQIIDQIWSHCQPVELSIVVDDDDDDGDDGDHHHHHHQLKMDTSFWSDDEVWHFHLQKPTKKNLVSISMDPRFGAKSLEGPVEARKLRIWRVG